MEMAGPGTKMKIFKIDLFLMKMLLHLKTSDKKDSCPLHTDTQHMLMAPTPYTTASFV